MNEFNDEETLWWIREQCQKDIVLVAQIYANRQKDKWSYGTYSPNDFPIMYEHGFLTGYNFAFKKISQLENELKTEKAKNEQLQKQLETIRGY